MKMRPTRRLLHDKAGTCHNAKTGVDALWPTDQRRTCRLVRCPPMHREWKKAPGVPGLQGWVIQPSRDQGAL